MKKSSSTLAAARGTPTGGILGLAVGRTSNTAQTGGHTLAAHDDTSDKIGRSPD